MKGREQEPAATTITTTTTVKQEPKEHENVVVLSAKTPVVDLSSDSDSDAESDDVADKEEREFLDSIIRKVNKKRDFVATSISASDDDHQVAETGGGGPLKKRVIAPVGFLEPLPQPVETAPLQVVEASKTGGGCRQFWKAGDYEGSFSSLDWDSATGQTAEILEGDCPQIDLLMHTLIHHTDGMDHVRVHPKFLHSNATSHKWALGAFAELLDNALDETSNGATYVNVDMLQSKKDGSRMLLIEDNGGGMDSDKMRQCMSLGYSAKSKLANTIGQYGNGFKTSTMRLGADVIVFSRCCGEDGKSLTQSIGLLSYTFLRSTGKQDIVVPILDYEWEGREWKKLMRSKLDDWSRNADTIAHWSPFSSEEELLKQFNLMNNHGTRVIIYNLWQDDQGLLELDFDADEHDIQIRGVNRDEKKIQMASQYPNSRHFLTYRHSLRSYASILYLRLPPGFRIILRGEDVVHHNIVNDMMLSEEVTYRPQPGTDGITKDLNMVAVVTIGFVKDAQYHIDVQGFNVYHKNRLIKPFWRIWNAAGSNGRGVIGVLEANFVEPAHDKQGFERTIVLSRLEARLLQMQKTYWSKCCHKIGYAPSNKKHIQLEGTSLDYLRGPSHCKSKSTLPMSKMPFSDSQMLLSHSNRRKERKETDCSPRKVDVHSGNGNISGKMGHGMKNGTIRSGKVSDLSGTSSSSSDADEDGNSMHENQANGSCKSSKLKSIDVDSNEHSSSSSISQTVTHLRKEINELRGSLKKKEDVERNLQSELQAERDRCKSLKIQLQEAERKMEEMNKEQESLIDIFSEERERRDAQEENWIKKLKEASATIQELVEKVRWLEK